MTEPQPTPVIATVTGKDLLDRLDALSASFRDFTQKLDDVPGKVADLEQRMRAREAQRCVTWTQLGAVVTVMTGVFGVVAAFLAMRG